MEQRKSGTQPRDGTCLKEAAMHFALLLPIMPHVRDNTQADYGVLGSASAARRPVSQVCGAWWSYFKAYWH